MMIAGSPSSTELLWNDGANDDRQFGTGVAPGLAFAARARGTRHHGPNHVAHTHRCGSSDEGDGAAAGTAYSPHGATCGSAYNTRGSARRPLIRATRHFSSWFRQHVKPSCRW